MESIKTRGHWALPVGIRSKRAHRLSGKEPPSYEEKKGKKTDNAERKRKKCADCS